MSLDEWLVIGIPAESIDAAIDWVAKIDQQPLTSEQERVFLAWLDEQPENQWSFEEISEAWSRINGLQEVKAAVLRSRILSFPVVDLPNAADEALQLGTREPVGVQNARVLWSAIAFAAFGLILALLL